MSTSPVDDVVELHPPTDSGFSGTAKFSRIFDAVLIAELVRRGYTVAKAQADKVLDDDERA